MRKIGKIIIGVFLSALLLLLLFVAYVYMAIQIEEPKINTDLIKRNELKTWNDTTFSYQDSWLRKNSLGLWEMYISGSPEELGFKNGILSQHLIHKQEEAFIQQLRQMIPSDSYLKFLKYVTAYMNRKLPDYIPEEFLYEIKAISTFASDDFDFIGDNYTRQLNYHAAHDIGHAMQNLHLVECTAFGVWAERSSDSALLVGRNFDFYVGDEFAENKIILFVKPDKGYAFSSITWGGMIGVVSGMNNQGLSITLNSAKSEIPFTAKTPVSIIAREILQYASNIQEAYSIACKRKSFVAESFMIASAKDNSVVIIEKTPDTTVLFYSNDHHISLTNHFQSETLGHTEINKENQEENVTTYRFERLEELLAAKSQFNNIDFVNILRDTKGKSGESIGLGNEGAVNQLIAHHSVVFKPQEKCFWISTKPYQIGAFMAYHLDSIFDKTIIPIFPIDILSERISADTSFLNNNYPSYLLFKSVAQEIKMEKEVDIAAFLNYNPHYFYTYELAGDYYLQRSEQEKASIYFKQALQHFIPNRYEEQRIKEKIRNLNNNY